MEAPSTQLAELQASIAELQARSDSEREAARKAQEASAKRIAELEAARSACSWSWSAAWRA